jgi:hypothetical protein
MERRTMARFGMLRLRSVAGRSALGQLVIVLSLVMLAWWHVTGAVSQYATAPVEAAPSAESRYEIGVPVLAAPLRNRN